MLKVNSFEKVQKVFNETRSNLSEILSAFEFWDTHANKMVFSQLSHLRDPFDSSESNTVSEGSGGPFTILIETSGSRKEHDDEKLETLLETLMENETVFDGISCMKFAYPRRCDCSR